MSHPIQPSQTQRHATFAHRSHATRKLERTGAYVLSRWAGIFFTVLVAGACGHVGIELNGDSGVDVDDAQDESKDEGKKDDSKKDESASDAGESASDDSKDDLGKDEPNKDDPRDDGVTGEDGGDTTSKPPPKDDAPTTDEPSTEEPGKDEPSKDDSVTENPSRDDLGASDAGDAGVRGGHRDAGPAGDDGPRDLDAATRLDASISPPDPVRDSGTPATTTDEPETVTEPSLDASIEPTLGTDTEVTEPSLDAGPATPDASGPSVLECAPDCACPEGDHCELGCNEEGCTPQCLPGSTCVVALGAATEVGVSCGDGAYCLAENTLAEDVAFTCSGSGQCEAKCGPASNCHMACEGTGTCVLKCGEAASCTITQCDNDAVCFVSHENVNTVSSLECVAEPTTECGADLLVCHAPCP